ncbi:radical SAM protein [Heliobacterium undosum]|uniref:Radical SAM protein n=1 Tax=Heliomicrobium undosum TaxID=121734 RepID=A0A845L961_9FIRM|nr:radical SAM protein [Heliomicrobium undosum]MZP29461.1 radical SAM protein [Heliomicrobium undosum]
MTDSVPAPSVFAIETVLGCDLRCPECALGGERIERPRGMMSLQDFRVIADKIRPYARYVYLHLWGEPMLNREIFSMVAYAAQFAKTNISTNGNVMTGQMAEALIASGVDDIILSIDGTTQEVYGHYRVGGKAERALAALELLQEANRRLGRKANIIPQFIVFEHNQHEMEAFRDVCDRLGLRPSFKAPYIRSGLRVRPSTLPQFCRPRYPDLEALKKAMAGCSNPREVFNILLDGTVTLCCHDYNGFIRFGNIFEQDVLEIWRSESYNQTRQAIGDGNPPDFCLNYCQSYYLDNPSPVMKEER